MFRFVSAFCKPSQLLLVVGLLLLLAPGNHLHAQQKPATKPVITDSTRTQPDVQPDSLRRRFDQERLLNGLKAYTRRKTIAGKVASALFNFTTRGEDRAGLDAELLDRQFDQHNYKVVRSINVTTLDAFGYSISDPNRQPRNILEKSGNLLHIVTSQARVRQVLLFRAGEELEPQDLQESERLLRQTSEILDARVFVNEATSTADSIDVQIITKDVFSISGSFQLRDVTAGIIGLSDANFLGQGHQFSNRYEYGRRDPQGWSYRGSYQVPFRNFIYAQARYRNQYQDKQSGFSVYRDFYSLNTKYAGAFSVDSYERGLTFYRPAEGQLAQFHTLRYNTQDLWVGRAFHLRSYDLGYENPGRYILAGRLLHTNYTLVPDSAKIQLNTNGYNDVLGYNDALLGLATVGYSVRRYYKDKYLFGFGRTEDIPTGMLATFTTGYELNSRQDRRYYGVRMAYASYSLRRGYLYVNGEFGSYLRRPENDWQQGQLTGELLYFTRLFHTGNYQWRHFLWLRSSLGFHRRPGEQLLTFDSRRGVRGFRSDTELRGQSRFILNYETTMFTPVSILGFRLAGVAFIDAAWLATKPGREMPFYDRPYTGFGLGLRFRNEYTAIRNIQILLGFYPRGQTNGSGFRIFENTSNYYNFSDFNFAQPGIIRYE
ncbi:hypothetical protein [Hymenobacter cavernae]|uniref:Bacterial surface antigen (D15) domain-containing protein n=1 Tax=Hymenobacter cavernae TaxID=2044852 RepID=A0ABQ1UEU4_9BACT|nr:hypothetical protein [Hymenobacter cavernae]GGF14585.1 hypothetical protein GCM10011383_27260 [Hymenobacter cavernae]